MSEKQGTSCGAGGRGMLDLYVVIHGYEPKMCVCVWIEMILYGYVM